MTYVIKISDKSPQAMSIINLLKTLAQDYDFLNITEDINTLTNVQEKELDRRHKYVKDNPTIGKTWEMFEKSL